MGNSSALDSIQSSLVQSVEMQAKMMIRDSENVEMQVMMIGFQAMKPQRQERAKGLSKTLRSYACLEKRHYSQNYSSITSFVLKRPRVSKATSVEESSGPSIQVKVDTGEAERRDVVDTGIGVNPMSKEIVEQYFVPLQKCGWTGCPAEGKQIQPEGKQISGSPDAASGHQP